MEAGRHQGSVRERLLSAADELFYAHGIASTGVDAVIERAGVATGSLYNNFGGKDALVTAYLEDRDVRWRVHWDACVAQHSNPVERVLAIFTAVQRWNDGLDANRGCAHVAATVQLDPAHPGVPAAATHKRHLIERLGELVAATDVDDPAEATKDILIVYEGIFSLLAMHLDEDPIGRARTLAARSLNDAQ